MRQFPKLVVTGVMVGLLSACAATTPPIDVTRFHQAPEKQLSTGSVKLIGHNDAGASSTLEQRTFEAAVLRELQKSGFAEVSGQADPDYLVSVSVEQNRITAGGERSPVSVGVGGSTGSYGSGLGLGIGINLGGRPKDKIATELSVRMSHATSEQVVWEGRSWVEAKQGSAAAQPGLASARLAEALFRDFPGVSGETIRVQ